MLNHLTLDKLEALRLTGMAKALAEQQCMAGALRDRKRFGNRHPSPGRKTWCRLSSSLVGRSTAGKYQGSLPPRRPLALLIVL